MLLPELKSALRSNIIDIIHENDWTELDDFSIIFSDKLAKEFIAGKRVNILETLKDTKTNFFKINKISKQEFATQVKDKTKYIVQIFKPINKHKTKMIGKQGIRKDFSEEDKLIMLRNQDHRCKTCHNLLNVIQYDHIDGNRTNNHISNGQALCPNCHEIKTREQLRKQRNII